MHRAAFFSHWRSLARTPEIYFVALPRSGGGHAKNRYIVWTTSRNYAMKTMCTLTTAESESWEDEVK